MKKIIGNIIFIIYAIIAVFVTICLLSYNEFKVTEFGETSLVLIDNEELQPNYNKGDLVIVNRDTRIRENEYNNKIKIYKWILEQLKALN